MIPIKTIEQCDSTMNVASEMFSSSSSSSSSSGSSSLPFAVRAIHQTRSRGTGGRTWLSNPGNLHLTIAVPMPFTKLSQNLANKNKSVPPKIMALFPCLLGIALFNALNKAVGFHSLMKDSSTSASLLNNSPLVLKWPNDVLIRKTGQKVCGNLIESAYNNERKEQALLVGIGVNVLNSVAVSDGGRKAGTLKEIIISDDDASSPSSSPLSSSSLEPEVVGQLICEELVSVISSSFPDDNGKTTDHQMSETGKAIIAEFQKRLDFTTKIFLRKKQENEMINSDDVSKNGVVKTERGDEPFVPIRLNEFGGLVVKSEKDGREIELSSDYLY